MPPGSAGVTPGVSVERNGKSQVLYKPLPHQLRFHEATETNVLMGGGAGTGKSLALRWDAYMRCFAIPRFKALIVRRTMPELRMSHLDHVPMEAELLGLGKDAWHATNYQLRFPNGSTVTFGHVEDETSVMRYLSSEFTLIAYDELTTFSLTIFAFLSSRARTTLPGVKALVRAGTNPLGPGASWVREWFVDKSVTAEESPGYNPDDYLYIHSTLDDNPYLGAEYEKRLMSLPSDAQRRAYRFGEWVTEGAMFSDFAPTKDGREWHVISHAPKHNGKPIVLTPGIEVFRALDWGFSSKGVCLWVAMLFDGTMLVFDEFVFTGMLPRDVAAEIKRRSQGMKIRYTVADPAVWAEHEGPSIAEQFATNGVPMIEGDRQRKSGWVSVHNWMREEVDDGNGARPKLRILKTCSYLVKTLPMMQVDEKDPEDIKTKHVEDHGADTLRYACMSRPTASRLPVNTELSWVRRQMLKDRPLGSRLGSEATRTY